MNPASSPLQGALFLARRFIAGRERPFPNTLSQSRGVVSIPMGLTAPTAHTAVDQGSGWDPNG
jgi:hypothetical protein